ncbi:MAG: DUF2730 family protein [Pyrobaculum sp.]
MIDPTAVINNIAAQAPLLAVALTVLYYSLDKKIEKLNTKIEKVEERVEKIEKRIEKIEDRVQNLEEEVEKLEGSVQNVENELREMKREFMSFTKAVVDFQETFIEFLEVKGVVSRSEAVLLKGRLSQLTPTAKSKYYTPEVRERLLAILNKDIDDFTWQDVEELDRISELILKEYYETGREDLLSYYPKLRMFIAMMRGILREKERETPSSEASLPQS